MQLIVGDVWDTGRDRVAVPTNIGWTKAGKNVMGRGVALQASRKYPDLAYVYGQHCRDFADTTDSKYDTFLFEYEDLVLVPTKSLNTAAPWLSWKGNASYDMVSQSTGMLARWRPELTVAVPLLGCGNGGLSHGAVFGILRRNLGDDRFAVVVRPEEMPHFEGLL